MSEAVETDSKTKAKGGRPRAIPDDFQEMIDFVVEPNVCERTRQNTWYRTIAINAVDGHDEFKWLCDGEAIMRGDGKSRRGILSELGRLQDEDAIRAVARELGKMDPRPTTREAVARIRRYRLGREAKGTYYDLVLWLERRMDEYVKTHPDMPREWIPRAFDDLYQLYAPDED